MKKKNNNNIRIYIWHYLKDATKWFAESNFMYLCMYYETKADLEKCSNDPPPRDTLVYIKIKHT